MKTSDTAEIKALEQRLIDGIKAKDVKQIMSCYSDDVFAFDVVPPQQYVGAAAFQKPWQGFLDMLKMPINAEVNDLVSTPTARSRIHTASTTSRERRTRASRSMRRFASRMSIARVMTSGWSCRSTSHCRPHALSGELSHSEEFQTEPVPKWPPCRNEVSTFSRINGKSRVRLERVTPTSQVKSEGKSRAALGMRLAVRSRVRVSPKSPRKRRV